MAVLRAGRSFGVVLDGEDRPVLEPDAAIAAVEKGNVRLFHPLRQALTLDRKAMNSSR